MPAYLSPVGNEVQTDANGNPLVGGQIFTYQAGTTTPIATYTGSDGLTAQANPIVLNSAGLPASPIWLPAGQAVKLVFKDANNVDYRPAADNITGINDPSTTNTVDQWVTFSGAPTYISATSFSLGGDQTNTFQVGRRVKSTNTGGATYSTITAASYNAGTGLTTVTVANTSGTLDSGLSQVSYGLLSALNPSVPVIRSATAQDSTSGTTKDFTGIPAWVKRITVMLSGVSTSGTSPLILQIGDSGGIEASGYSSSVALVQNATGTQTANATTGFALTNTATAATVCHGSVVLTLLDAATNTWTAALTLGLSNSAATFHGAGSKALSATLDRIRLTTSGGSDTFDAGLVNVLYE